jgi:ribosomal protein S18 acetylase RimI-like enzyme
MSSMLFLRRAKRADLDTLILWRRETARWLAQEKGTDQWGSDYPREKLIGWIDAGETWMASLSPGGEPVATITVSQVGDPDLWTLEELKVPALYIYKANVERMFAGREIGKSLVLWAKAIAGESGLHAVRIDVWSTNHSLHEYYKRLGFVYLRTVPGVKSGALFSAPAEGNKDFVTELDNRP